MHFNILALTAALNALITVANASRFSRALSSSLFSSSGSIIRPGSITRPLVSSFLSDKRSFTKKTTSEKDSLEPQKPSPSELQKIKERICQVPETPCKAAEMYSLYRKQEEMLKEERKRNRERLEQRHRKESDELAERHKREGEALRAKYNNEARLIELIESINNVDELSKEKETEILNYLTYQQLKYLEYKIKLLEEQFNWRMDQIRQQEKIEKWTRSVYDQHMNDLKKKYNNQKRELIKTIYIGYDHELESLKTKHFSEKRELNTKHSEEFYNLNKRQKFNTSIAFME